jgi:CDGSH-type Zn-finger protein/uncharacterized Fe-S cluster protein YjdI
MDQPVQIGKPTDPSLDVATADDITVSFDGRRCIHARFCVTRAPTVFLSDVDGPWMHPDAGRAEEISAVIEQCPSGALAYARRDGCDEKAPPVNLATVRENGPYWLRGDLKVEGQRIGFRAALCRCGASKRKPFCDKSHKYVGFSATGEPPSIKSEDLAARDGALAIAPEPDGPLVVRGNLEIVAGSGRTVATLQEVRLCRCGASANKPFCDESHRVAGFRST